MKRLLVDIAMLYMWQAGKVVRSSRASIVVVAVVAAAGNDLNVDGVSPMEADWRAIRTRPYCIFELAL